MSTSSPNTLSNPGSPEQIQYEEFIQPIQDLWQMGLDSRTHDPDLTRGILGLSNDPAFRTAVVASALGSVTDSDTELGLGSMLAEEGKRTSPDETIDMQFSNMLNWVSQMNSLRRSRHSPADLRERVSAGLQQAQSRIGQGSSQDRAATLAALCFSSAAAPEMAVDQETLVRALRAVGETDQPSAS